MALHFDDCHSELDTEQVLDYLQYCKKTAQNPLPKVFLSIPSMDSVTSINLNSIKKHYNTQQKNYKPQNNRNSQYKQYQTKIST
jgi:hypothetical protein